MSRVLLLICLLPALAGCNRAGAPAGTEAEPLPAIAGAQLSDALALLDRELAAALQDGLDRQGRMHFARAEAITDRLLETQYPFPWLRASNYSVDARLRQIQALADRITAMFGSKAPGDTILADMQRLRRDVVELRRELAQSGGPAPPSLERLLAGRDTLDLAQGEGAGGE